MPLTTSLTLNPLQKEAFGTLEHNLTEQVREVAHKTEKNAAQLRLVQTDIKGLSKFMEQRNEDSQKLHDILGKYKDRIAENFQTMTDEFTEDLKKLEYRYIQMSEALALNKRSFTALDEKTKHQTVELDSLDGKFKDLRAWQSKINHLLTFEPRLATLENQAKSDLIAVTTKLEEVQMQSRNHIDKVDAFKMAYGLQTDMLKAVMDPLVHRSGKLPTDKNPKRDCEVQCLLNLMDWQLKLVAEDHQQD